MELFELITDLFPSTGRVFTVPSVEAPGEAGTRKVSTIQAHKGQRVVCVRASGLGETHPPAG